jgi:RNA polymerase sigma-70 factor (ECF subfamily)
MNRDEIVKAAFGYRGALLSHAFGMLRDWTLAEDVVQDAFIVVMNKWEEFRPGTSLYAWLRQIVHFKACEALRDRCRAPATPVDEALLAQVAATLEEHFDEEIAERQGLMHRALRRCLSFLNSRAMGIISGFYGEARSCESIAQAQRRSVNAIRLSLARLRRKLHECMVRQLPSHEGRA